MWRESPHRVTGVTWRYRETVKLFRCGAVLVGRLSISPFIIRRLSEGCSARLEPPEFWDQTERRDDAIHDADDPQGVRAGHAGHHATG